METKQHATKKCLNDKIREENKIYFRKNNNENRTIQTLWNVAKIVLREKFMLIQVFFKK